MSCHQSSREFNIIFKSRQNITNKNNSSELFSDSESTLIVIGVIGKSNLPNCNKMSCFNLFNCHASFVYSENSRREVSSSSISFVFSPLRLRINSISPHFISL